jgi:iron(III) transport system substrate-binding protein
MRALRALTLAALLPMLVAAPVRAQTLEALVSYAGPDRTERLVAGAKKEGTVTIYSSITIGDMSALSKAFQAKYGITVKHWRASSEDIRNRAMREYAAGRHDADITETAGADMEAMVREGVFQKVATPVTAELIPQATLPHGQWIATRLNLFAGVYNTRVFKTQDAPRTYDDLLQPRFKGRLALEAEDANWFMAVVGAMGEEKGVALFRDITARNGMSIRRGHTLLANLVASGEVALALTAYSYRAEQLVKEGAPVQIVYLPPVVGFASGTGVFKRAPHPHAALLFQDFLLSDGQPILAQRQMVPTRRSVQAPPEGLVLIDLARYLDEGERWQKLFRTTFATR